MRVYSSDDLRSSRIEPPVTPAAQKREGMKKEEASGLPAFITSRTRIAVYDSELMAPRVIDIQGLPTNEYIEQVASKTYLLAQQQGGNTPYAAIREVTENLIHAHFKEPVISIMDKGNTITFADQGPGIKDKQKALLPGYTSATADMKEYIRGVGSGLPLVKGYLSITGGRLLIEDNINDGTVITITFKPEEPAQIKQEADHNSQTQSAPVKKSKERNLSAREDQIMKLFVEYGEVGQTDIKKILDIPVASATRALERLEAEGLLTVNRNKKRVLTVDGFAYLRSRFGVE